MIRHTGPVRLREVALPLLTFAGYSSASEAPSDDAPHGQVRHSSAKLHEEVFQCSIVMKFKNGQPGSKRMLS